MPARPAPLARPAAIVAALSAGTVGACRRGYGVGGRTVVRCRRGHLSTTIWLADGSLKRLGWWRLQWCPVRPPHEPGRAGRAGRTSDEEREFAALQRDSRIA